MRLTKSHLLSPYAPRCISSSAPRHYFLRHSSSNSPQPVSIPFRRPQSVKHTVAIRNYSILPPPASKMSFSNTDTGGKHADPYKSKNKDEPALKEKIEDLVHFVSNSKFGMMTTRIESSGLLTSRCMAVAAQESGGIDLLFHTNTESGKTNDLSSDPSINIAFLNSTGEWASISGSAEIITNRAVVREYYSPALKAWVGDLGDGIHDGGPEDPRIGVIKVVTRTATYAITTGNVVGRGLEIAKGAVTGESPKVNKLREISEEEINEWRKIST